MTDTVGNPTNVRYLDSFILSRLKYGLATVWLVKAQQRRLDGFMARCLRRVLRIPSAYVSQVSNATVFARAGVRPFCSQLLRFQLSLLRKVAVADAGNLLRKDVFVVEAFLPHIGSFLRIVGRPRQDWASQLMREGQERIGTATFGKLLSDRSPSSDIRWKAALGRL